MIIMLNWIRNFKNRNFVRSLL